MASKWLLCDEDDNIVAVVDPFEGKTTPKPFEEPSEENSNCCNNREVFRDLLVSFLIMLISLLAFGTFFSVDIGWTRILLTNDGNHDDGFEWLVIVIIMYSLLRANCTVWS